MRSLPINILSLLSIFLLVPMDTLGDTASCDGDATACYDGPISAEANRTFFERIDDRNISRLIIRSSGGEVEAGIELGNRVYRQKIDVEVSEYCLSSCANYVFTAGNRKIIPKGAVVAWHGNYRHLQLSGEWQEDIPKRMRRLGEDEATARAAVKAQMEKLVVLETAFFNKTGVDEKLCRIGKEAPYKVPNYYFLSGKAMQRFGLTGLEFPADYEKTDISGFAVLIQYLDLDGEE